MTLEQEVERLRAENAELRQSLAYEQILGFTPRLLVASFLAYLVGEFTNSFISAKNEDSHRRSMAVDANH